ncbi:MAG: FAD-dependent oxidoreductase [Candidatus Andersenbacteria bacterium]
MYPHFGKGTVKSASRRQRVLVIGGGYAGVRVARDLARARRRGVPLEIVLVSNDGFHLETPALYEVATAYLDRESTLSSEQVQATVCVDLAEIFAELPVTIQRKTVSGIETTSRLVTCRDATALSYDLLVVALGAHVATYGVPGVQEFAFGVKTLHEALELRHHIVRHFLMAKKLPPEKTGGLLSFVVVGAGAAGVETAAELAGQVYKLCTKYGVALSCPRVSLVEAGEDILPGVAEPVRKFARTRLQKLGVEIMTHQRVTAVGSDHVVLTDERRLPTNAVIWTGGLVINPILSAAGLPVQRWGVACESSLQVVGHPDIYAAGDCAIPVSIPEKIPATVPVAYTQAKLVASNIVRQLQGKPLVSYRFHSLGALIALGGKRAVATLPGNRGLVGRWPWIIKQFVMLRYWLGYLAWHRALRFWWHRVVAQSYND